MAIRPDYDIGTVTLVASGANFTTTGASLQTAAVQAGDAIITPSGHILIIAAITGQNSGTLFLPCPAGAAGTNLPLRIRFQPDGSRYQGAVRNLVELISSGNVEAFAALVGSSGLVPIFTGVGTMDLADPETFGIQDPNGSLGKLAALILAGNKALVTDGTGNPEQINLGLIGRNLIALASGTATQIIQGDGLVVNKSSLPISTDTQTALNGKFNTSGGTATGRIVAPGLTSTGTGGTSQSIAMHPFGTGDTRRGELYSEVSGTVNTVLRVTNPPSSQDVFFVFRSNGSMTVPGALSKGSGTFLTDHPLDPFNKNLRHGFVESTEYVNLYRGMVDLVDGRMIVDIDAAFGMTDGTFEALNADVLVSSLQNQYGPDRVWVEGPADSGKFTIICEDAESTATIAWMVTGRRNDAFVRSDLDPNTDSEGRFIPEFEKEDA